MNTKEIREVLRNELECVKRRMGTMCANGRDCINCDLALPDDVVISAYESVLSLINRPKAEIERLKAKILVKDNINDYNTAQLRTAREELRTAKSEAIKEFARKLENALDKRLGDDIPIFGDRDNVYCTVSDIYNVIDDLVKEMTEVGK